MKPLLIPILAGAGASLLPVVFAAIAGTLALLTRPRDLWAAIRARPARAAGVAAVMLLLLAAAFGLARLPRTAHRDAEPRSETKTDWASVALEIIRAERAAAENPPVTPALPSKPGLGPVKPPPPPRATPAVPRPPGSSPPTPRPARPIVAPLGGLRQLWRYTEPDALFLSTPAARGGRVYGATCLMEPEGSLGTIFCLDGATGREIWRTDRAGGGDLKGFYSSPVLSPDGRRLVIGQGIHFDRGCALLCLDAATGRVLWQAPTPLHVEGTPAISGGLVIAGAGAIEGPEHEPQGDPGYVFAVRLSDGKEVWRYPLADPESSPAVSEGIVYIGSGIGGNAVAALRMGSDIDLKKARVSRLLWRTPTPYPALAPVTVSGDLVLIGTGNGDLVNAAPHPAGAVIAMDRRTGKVRWKVSLPDAVLGGVAVSGDTAYCPVRNGELVALSTADGSVRWRARPAGTEPLLATPTVAGDTVCVVSRDGGLYLLNAKTGAVRERHYVNAPDRPGDQGLSVGSATVSDGRLYVGSETGGLSGFAPRAKASARPHVPRR